MFGDPLVHDGPVVTEVRKLGAIALSYETISGDCYMVPELRLSEDATHMDATFMENAGLCREIQEVDRRKDEHLAVVGHELRTPLAAIRSAIQVVRLKGSPDPDLGLATTVIEHQVDQMTRIVDDLLDIARIARGKIHLRREVVDVKTVVARAVETSRPLIDARKHELEISLPERPLEVEGDLTRLVQVVSNLLNNSAKYTEEGGRIELSAEAEGDLAIARVRDTGVGITPAALPTIFDLFTQVRFCESRSAGGLGIGLNLVRNLVEMHGGSVHAASAGLGLGSEFVVRLPLVANAPPSAPAAGKKPEGALNGLCRRILIIDDNRALADTMATLLRVTGHDVSTAYDGATGLDLARVQTPEVVLCDVSMPGMSGLEVARQLRQALGPESALLVALSGYGDEEDERRSQEAGFNEHLVKPVGIDALRALLSRATLPAPGLA
jgi:signal transduction histidine kinase/CheY-like chemotaxis protein